jgi:glutathione S-transferase
LSVKLARHSDNMQSRERRAKGLEIKDNIALIGDTLESGAICAYLADAFPAARLAPSNNEPARGTYLRWMFFGAGCVEPALFDRMFARPPVERPSALGYGCYEDVLNALEKAITPGPLSD